MLRKILSFFFALFVFLPTARGAEMVNVEYIHQYLNARWGIDLPYNPELKNPKVAANMEYLLTVVDIANEYLNGEKTTSYGTGEYATKLAADTIATNTAIDTLVRGPFTMTTTPDTTSYSMTIGAAGTFVINWGDGEIETIRNKPLGNVVYSHTYDAPGEYDITLGGRATDYAIIDMDTSEIPTFSFTLADLMGGEVPTNLAKISGRLGRVFPTLENGKNPNFYGAFSGAPITEIPADLFDGVHGAPVDGMFVATFMATQVTSVPANLFGELNGNGAMMMFSSTFSDCQNLTTIEGPLFSGTLTPADSMFSSTFSNTDITSVPANLFGELNGDGAPRMFNSTFSDCQNLTTIEGPLFSGTLTPAESMFKETFSSSGITSIPANLFGTLNGDGAPSMFEWTFADCANLTTIEGPLFSGTLTPADHMFNYTFSNTALTEIPADLFADIQGAPEENMFSGTFSGTDITEIPADLFAGVRGAPADYMFSNTFADTALTEIPADLFAGIRGAPAEYMFSGTFSNTAITSIPANLFGTLNGDGAKGMFNNTFNNCANLATIEGPLFSGEITPAERMFSYTFADTALTEIPADLFAGIRGAPAQSMFISTFYSCIQLQSIPENLFAGISGPAAEYMFGNTFVDCRSLTGPSARINGQYLYEIWPDITSDMNTYLGSRNLDDYDQIPDNWK